MHVHVGTMLLYAFIIVNLWIPIINKYHYSINPATKLSNNIKKEV